mgnify:CR=1 FL=1
MSAWVRMGRCHLEQRQWDEAVSALRAALQISPTHTVATNLLNEVRKRRALAPTAVQRTMTGFGAREFALVEALPAADAVRGTAAADRGAVRCRQPVEHRREDCRGAAPQRRERNQALSRATASSPMQAAMWSRSTTGAAGSRSSIWAG